MVTAVVSALAGTWLISRGDERRVNAACDTYLTYRADLRTTTSETLEAMERAHDANADRVGDEYFNDAEAVRSWIDRWVEESPRVVKSLNHDEGASGLERGTIRALTQVEQGLVELKSLLESAGPLVVADWLPELEARMQGVDDNCLAAARGSWR